MDLLYCNKDMQKILIEHFNLVNLVMFSVEFKIKHEEKIKKITK